MTINLSILYTAITIIASLIGSLGVICAFLKKRIDTAVEKIQKPILEKVENNQKEVLEKIAKLDENHCKDYLISFLNDVKNGVHKNQYEISRAHDVYEHYTNVLHKNSYIHAMWEEVMENKNEKE